MANSPLATCRIISPHRTSPRNHAIDRITIHCTVGQGTAETICNIMQPEEKRASCNYAVGMDGSIGVCVDECDRSWCSSSSENDHRAITIETSSDTTYPYRVTDTAYNALLRLCTDICRRMGKDTLLWIDDRETALKRHLSANEMILTVHHWFAPTNCPGAYLMSRMGKIAESVTNALKTTDKENKLDHIVSEYRRFNHLKDIPAWAKPTIEKLIDNGWIFGVETRDGRDGPALDLSMDMLRTFVILDRAGVLKTE